MTAQIDLERRLRAHLDARADPTVLDGQLGAVLAETDATRQRPGWLAVLRDRSLPPGAIVAPSVPRVAWMLVGVALLIFLLIAALAIGTRPAPARLTGQIVYGRPASAGADPTVHVMNADGSGDRVLLAQPEETAFLSPDGRQVGFIDAIVGIDGSGYREFSLTSGALLLSCWDWSPDGRSCAARGASQISSASGVYLLSALDHARLGRLTSGHDIPGAFSPDGSQIAFVRLPNHGDEGQLMVVGVDGSGERSIGTIKANRELGWSHDGRSLFVVGGGLLFRVDVATGAARPIVPADSVRGAILGVAVSPDGARLLIRREAQPGNADLFTMRPDGSDVIRLTNTPENEAFADWGPAAPTP